MRVSVSLASLLSSAVLTAGLLAGCGSSSSSSVDADGTLRQILEQQKTQSGQAVTIDDVSCVHDTGDKFQCLVTLMTSTGEEKISGSLTCDTVRKQCLWKPD